MGIVLIYNLQRIIPHSSVDIPPIVISDTEFDYRYLEFIKI